MHTVRPVARLAGLICLAAFVLALAPADVAAQAIPDSVVKSLKLRAVGPTRQGGRFVDYAVPLQDTAIIYAATGSGGLWKSINNGQSWTPIFDNQSVISIGDVTVAPSNPNIVWVGTGEHTASRSTYWGDGVYLSTDAGKTWTNMGLKDSHHIGRIVIDPKDPNIVYVASLGPLYTQGGERGVYKTVDGGKTWTKSLAVTADGRDVGVADLVMDPKNPKVLYAAAYDKERLPWTFNLGGPGSGIYKTTDAGKTWTKLTTGLPGGMLGRIGLAVYLRNPNILYANIENANKPGMSDADRLKELREGKSSAKMIGEEVYRSDDAGKTWRKVSPDGQNVGGGPGYYYMQIYIDPNNADRVYVNSVSTSLSTDGGKTWSRAFQFGGDDHALWINPANSKHMILGYDHGMGITYDSGATWYHPDEMPLAQLYAVGYDNMVPYNVAGGLQDNGSWRGPSSKRGGGSITLEDWKRVGGGDGMYNEFDAVTNRYLYNESQFGPITRHDLYTGETKSIRHQDPALRWNWNAPILVSPHDSNVIYHGANKLLKSNYRGEGWVAISDDLTTNDPKKLTTGKGGDGNIQYCTITTIDESPVARDVLWVGTDDGNVWVTKDGGKAWTKVNDKIPNKPDYWVSRVVASNHQVGTAYVTFTGMRNDNFKPYVYKTTDFGATWTSIVGNLPDKPVNVIREDPVNPNLLFVGADFGLYASIDGGRIWTELKEGMPTQPVYDLKIHPREKDLIVATHGRGIFITDISALQEMGPSVLASDFHVFQPESKVKWVVRHAMASASANFDGQSEPNGVVISYYQKGASGDVTVKVMQGTRVMAETKGPNTPGMNQVLWNMRVNPATVPGVAAAGGRGGRGGFAGGGGRGGATAAGAMPTFGGMLPADVGTYTVVVTAGGKTFSKTVQVIEDVWFDRMF